MSDEGVFMKAMDYGEPWRVKYGTYRPEGVHGIYRRSLDEYDDGRVVETDSGYYPPTADEAERIVACVNACKGIPTALLDRLLAPIREA